MAYAQIIDPEIFEPMTAPGVRANAAPRSDRTSLVALVNRRQAEPTATGAWCCGP